MEQNYVVYHLHSDHSNGVTNIDSVTKYDEYVTRAKELNMKALGFSEHGNIFRHHKKRLAIENAGMKYIHASEFYVTETLQENVRDNYHVVLIAKDNDGFHELNRLSSLSFNRADTKVVDGETHFYYQPRITFEELIHTSDHIIVATACLGGILNRGSDELRQRYIEFLSKNKHRCFLEIQHHNVEDQKRYNYFLYSLHQEYHIPLIAGTDTHALDEEQLAGRKLLQTAKNVYFEGEDGWDLSFKTYDELCDAYKRQSCLPEDVWHEAIQNTNIMADMIEAYELNRETKYPKLYENPVDTFKQITYDECSKHPYLNKRYSKEKLNQVIDKELEVYEKTESIDFMLLQYRLRQWEKGNGVQCGYGRGSVSGSQVAYALGITEMDSMRFGLNFFRFMNPSRVTNADIDTDYSNADRDKVKEYLLREKMGLPTIKSAEIITFNTIALKGSIRDVCRGLYKDSNNNYVSLADTICKAVDANEDRARETYPDVFKYVDIVQGTITSIGTHASGVLVSDLSIDETVGLCSTKDSRYPVSQLDMKELDDLMYVKLDILGLDNIGIINEVCKAVGIERLTPDNTPLDDEAVWKSIRDDSTMIFQWESNSAQHFLRSFMSDETVNIAKAHNKNFSYIKWFSFGNGLIRPGCASFRDSVANGDFLVTGFKELDEFLAPTFGHITMQEDIMRFLVQFCGYSDAESDTVRRGIAKKYGTEKFIDEIHNRFLSYSHEHYGVEVAELERIFPPIKQGVLDATDYAFSWNHSDSYSCIGYICGYLRYYYPVEYITAALNVVSAKNAEGTDKKLAEITRFAKEKKISIHPVKFRHSRGEYFASDGGIYKGLSAVKGLKKTSIRGLIGLKDETFITFNDFLFMAVEKKISLSDVEKLIKLDYFSEFGDMGILIRDFDVFNSVYKIKDMSKEKALSVKISFDLIRTICEKETEKLFKNVDVRRLIEIIQNNKPHRHISVKERIDMQLELLGHIEMVDKQYKGICYCVDVSTSFSPRLQLYALANGNLIDVKIRKEFFKGRPIKKGDVVMMKNGSQKNKMSFVNGKWEQTNELEWWITDYEVLHDKF